VSKQKSYLDYNYQNKNISDNFQSSSIHNLLHFKQSILSYPVQLLTYKWSRNRKINPFAIIKQVGGITLRVKNKNHENSFLH